jgi:hypothetical protein
VSSSSKENQGKVGANRAQLKGHIMGSFPTIFARRPRQHGSSLRSRLQYHPSVEVLDERLAPSVAGTSNPIIDGPTVSSVAHPTTADQAVVTNSALHTNTGTLPTAARTNPTKTVVSVAGYIPPGPGVSLPNVLVAVFDRPLPATVVAVPVVTAVPAAPSPVSINVGGIRGGEVVSLMLHNVPGQLTATEGQTITFTALADYGPQPAGNPHFSLEPVEGAGFPEGAEINPTTGEFSWRPTAGFYAFRVRVRDGDNTATQLIRIHVEEALPEAVRARPPEAGAGEDYLLGIPDEVLGAAFAPPADSDMEQAGSVLPIGAADEPGSAVKLVALTGLAACVAWPQPQRRRSPTQGFRRATARVGA